jgi:hypothetical protein
MTSAPRRPACAGLGANMVSAAKMPTATNRRMAGIALNLVIRTM